MVYCCVQADTPGSMEYGSEDGEIVDEDHHVQLSEPEAQDGEYDPLMAGNMEVFSVLVSSLDKLVRFRSLCYSWRSRQCQSVIGGCP